MQGNVTLAYGSLRSVHQMWVVDIKHRCHLFDDNSLL